MNRLTGSTNEISTDADLLELLRLCGASNTPLRQKIRGLTQVGDATQYCWADLSPMNRLLHYEAGDLTLSCQAGYSLEELQALVATKSQRLTIETTSSVHWTAGSLAAFAPSSFLDMRFGGVANQFLGFQAATAKAELIKGGGHVVKNVTGYDYVRLFCGARNALGIFTEVCFRLRPLAIGGATLQMSFDDFDQAYREALVLRDLSFAATGLALHRGIIAPTPTWQLSYRIEGAPQTLVEAKHVLSQRGFKLNSSAHNNDGLWQILTDFAADPQRLRCLGRPSTAAKLARDLLVKIGPKEALLVDPHRGLVVGSRGREPNLIGQSTLRPSDLEARIITAFDPSSLLSDQEILRRAQDA